jgi:hypothetical protein
MMRVITMIVMLIVLIPLAILFGWAVVHDLKRRRRHALPVEMESQARAIRASADDGLRTSRGAIPGGHDGGGRGL